MKACLNCLGSGHTARDCFSKHSCRTCGRKHHSLLHRGDAPPPAVQQPTTLVSTFDSTCNTASADRTMILGTCITTIETKGKLHKARALLDSGSSLTFITSRMVQSLKLHKTAAVTAIAGFQQTTTPVSRHKVEFSLRIPSGTVTIPITVEAVVVDVIMGDLPSNTIPAVKESPFLTGLPLADLKFDQPSRIDLLLGVDVLPQVMTDGLVRSADRQLSATQTVYGWVVTGWSKGADQAPSSYHCLKTQVDQNTQDLLVKFWQVEDVSSTTTLQTKDEVAAVEHFKTTHSREPDGRYVVKLPRRSDALALGCSREQARRRYLQNEKSLQRKGRLPDFVLAVQDYVDRKHAEKVPESDLCKPESDSYFLPMHGVLKEASTTTKLRIVFDASARSSSGVSLNDQLLPGPNMYPHLTSLIISFRQYRVGLTGDISKMFREVGLHPEERDLHRYLVKGDHQTFQEYRMTRLTFGVTCSPFLATQVLQRIMRRSTPQQQPSLGRASMSTTS